MAAVKKDLDPSEETSLADADARAIAEVKEATHPQGGEPDDDDDDEGLDFPDDDEPANDNDPEPRPGRKERRQARYRDLQERAERAERAANAAVSLLRQQQQPPTQAQQQPQGNELEQFELAYEHNQRRQQMLANNYQARLQALQYQDPQSGRWLQRQMAPEEEQHFLTESRGLQLEAQEIATLRAAAKHGYRPQGRQVDPYVAFLNAEFADVSQNPVGKARAYALYIELLQSGEADGPQLLKKVYEETRASLSGNRQQQQRRKPTADTRARYTGSTGGSSPRGGDAPARSNRVELPAGLSMKDFKKMADQALPHVKDDKKRYARFYKESVLPSLKS